MDRTKCAPSIETEGGSGLLCAVLAGREVGGVHERNVVHETTNDTQAKSHHDDYAGMYTRRVHAPSG